MSAFPTAQSFHLELEYWTVAEVAALLRVKEPTVYTWVREDPSLPAIKIRGTLRFRRDALLRWLREREQGRPTPRKRLLSVASTVNAAPARPPEVAR